MRVSRPPADGAELLHDVLDRATGSGEITGLSPAAIDAVPGSGRDRLPGCPFIRDTLSNAEYLDVEFVRRTWRLAWYIDDGATVALSPEVSFPGDLPGKVGIRPGAESIDFRRLVCILAACGVLTSGGSCELSDATLRALSGARVGPMYHQLCFGMLRTMPWGTFDALPEYPFMRSNAFAMLALILRSEDGVTAAQLAALLGSLQRRGGLAEERGLLPRCEELTARLVHERFLAGWGTVLGLIEPQPGSRGVSSRCSVTALYRATPLARRVFLAHL